MSRGGIGGEAVGWHKHGNDIKYDYGTEDW